MAINNRKIDLMIIGAQKAATSSLKEYLNEHPEVVMHFRQEFAYFCSPDEQQQGFERTFDEYYSNPKTGAVKVAAKHAGIHEKEEYVKALYDHNPACILVFVLRNPVDRAYSSYQMEVSQGLLSYSFDDLKEHIEKYKAGEKTAAFRLFFDLGMYASQLKFIFRYFPASQMMIYLQEDVRDRPADVMREVYSALQVNSSFTPVLGKLHNVSHKSRSFLAARMIRQLSKPTNPVNRIMRKVLSPRMIARAGSSMKKLNSTEAKFPPMSADMKAFLVEFYSTEIMELSRMINRDLSSWLH